MTMTMTMASAWPCCFFAGGDNDHIHARGDRPGRGAQENWRPCNNHHDKVLPTLVTIQYKIWTMDITPTQSVSLVMDNFQSPRGAHWAWTGECHCCVQVGLTTSDSKLKVNWFIKIPQDLLNRGLEKLPLSHVTCKRSNIWINRKISQKIS